MNTDTLLISNLPNFLNQDDCRDLFFHFGAYDMHYYGTKGPMKNKAHVFYRKPEDAEIAMKQLHQLDVCGSKLVVRFTSSKNHRTFSNILIENDNPILDNSLNYGSNLSEDIKIKQKISSEINSISHYYNFDYPINPDLKYSYPLPTVNILTNIANALASVPKFYVQVLHLMNKMNLPAPFGSFNLINLDEEIEELESEIESDSEIVINTNKRKLKPKEYSKLVKLRTFNFPNISFQSNHSVILDRTVVFEEPFSTISSKKIDIKVGTEMDMEISQQFFEPDLALESGFGKIFPATKDCSTNENNIKELEWNKINFISIEDLKKNKISQNEMNTMQIFKNYSTGDPTIRLYIKNLSKRVTENDLHYIYGMYINWDSNDEKIMYDIRLMKEGKMKGQAFITLPNLEAATKALSQTNGYILYDKPIVVCYARSAKSKLN